FPGIATDRRHERPTARDAHRAAVGPRLYAQRPERVESAHQLLLFPGPSPASRRRSNFAAPTFVSSTQTEQFTAETVLVRQAKQRVACFSLGGKQAVRILRPQRRAANFRHGDAWHEVGTKLPRVGR